MTQKKMLYCIYGYFFSFFLRILRNFNAGSEMTALKLHTNLFTSSRTVVISFFLCDGEILFHVSFVGFSKNFRTSSTVDFFKYKTVMNNEIKDFFVRLFLRATFSSFKMLFPPTQILDLEHTFFPQSYNIPTFKNILF